MQITDLLLDNTNNFSIDEKQLCEFLHKCGKEHLWSERTVTVFDVVVIHYISAIEIAPENPFDLAEILKIFCLYDVSSHFLINRQGRVYRLVPETSKAWHCGGSRMPPPDNRLNVNDFSIGVELMATENSGFTIEQYDSVVNLAAYLEKKYSRLFTYVGHDMIAGKTAVEEGLRINAKVDPGALFDWHYLENRINASRSGNNCKSDDIITILQ